MKTKFKTLSATDKSRIVEMAWEDRTPFEAIENLYNLNLNQVIELIRHEINPGAFRVWRKRMNGRKTKHLQLRPLGVIRSHCKTQYKHRTSK